MLPYDVELSYSGSGRGLMLARDENGGLLYKKALLPEIVAQQRTDAFSYQHRDPRVDIPAAFERFTLGAGFEDAVDTGEAGFKGYNYSQGIDASWGSRAYLSPAKQTTTGMNGATNPVKWVQTSFGLFTFDSETVYRWGVVWASVYTTGAGGQINDLIEFTNANATYLVAALRGSGYAYTTDGTYWTISESAGTTPAFRAAANSNANSTTITIGEPAGATSNDILLATFATNSTSNYMVPASTSAWRLVANVLTASGFVTTYWHRRAGSAPSLVFNTSAGGSVQIEAGCSAYQNCVTFGSPIDASSSRANAAATNHTLTGITTLGPNRLVVGHVGIGGSAAITEPGSTTERYDSTGGATISVESFDFAAATPAATGNKTATTAGSQNSGTVLLALKPTYTGANDVSRWAIRGSATGNSVLWALDSRGNIRSATDPTSPASWSTSDAIQLGPNSPTIYGVEVIDNVFYVVHSGGITSYDGTTVSTVYTNRVAPQTGLQVARPVVGPDLNLYLTFGTALLRYSPTESSITKVWPRGPQSANPEVSGTISSIAPSDRFMYFSLFRTSQSGYYLIKFDPSASVELEGEPVWPVHTVAFVASNMVNIGYLTASSTGLSTTNPVIAFSDSAQTSFFILPKPGYRPEDDSACRFSIAGSEFLFGSYIPFGAQGFPKWLTRGDIEAVTTSTSTVVLQYQVPAGSPTTIVTANTALSGRTSASLSAPVSITTVREKVVMTNTSTTANTPVLKGTVLHAAPNAPRDIGLIFTAVLKDGQQTNQNTTSKYQAAEVETFLFASVNQLVTIRDPRGTSQIVKVIDVDTVGFKYGPDGQPETLLQITAGQLTS